MRTENNKTRTDGCCWNEILKKRITKLIANPINFEYQRLKERNIASEDTLRSHKLFWSIIFRYTQTPSEVTVMKGKDILIFEVYNYLFIQERLTWSTTMIIKPEDPFFPQTTSTFTTSITQNQQIIHSLHITNLFPTWVKSWLPKTKARMKDIIFSKSRIVTTKTPFDNQLIFYFLILKMKLINTSTYWCPTF